MKLSKDILKRLNAITDKRSATVIQHIIKHGSISTEELASQYGYEHAPRAARDVRERGVNLVTFRVKSSDGKNIAAYKFGEPVFVDDIISKVRGRTALSNTLKKALIDKYGAVCFVYLQPMEERLLQIDHRIPYEIGGEQDDDINGYMLLSPSANRAKSWACEHCPNWEIKDPVFCGQCFWAHPENYTHIAGSEGKQIIVTLPQNIVNDYYKLVSIVGEDNVENKIKEIVSEFIESMLQR